MQLVFLGTRGNTEARTRRHRMHSALLATHAGVSVLLDCGADWLGRLDEVAPDAIVLTHAHPDHVWGLKEGAPCPVYATEDTWSEIETYPVAEPRTIHAQMPFDLGALRFEAFPVEHSILAPAVGYRVTDGGATVFYVPDVVSIHARGGALHRADLYIGDGATLTRSMVRRIGDELFGHTPVRTQLGWCEKEGVTRAIFTHCGTEIVTGDERVLGARLRTMAREHGVEEARIAYDGLEIELP